MTARPGSTLSRIGWTSAALLLATVAARLRPMRALPIAIGITALERRALLAAYPIALFAILTGRPALAGVVGALAAHHTRQGLRERGGRRPHPIEPGSLRMRLVTANLLCSNPDIGRAAAEIADEDADVVVLQEVTPEVLATLRASPLWTAYPHRRAAERPGFHGAATLSRWPILGHALLDVAGTPMLRTDIATAHGPVRVINVHTVAPLTRAHARRWVQQVERLQALADADATPVILAGDFNATGDHAPFRRLLTGGLRDASDAVGSGAGSTWPAGHRVLPPLLRLDHVVTSADVEVGALSRVPTTGSDHARLVADLGIPDPRRARE